MQNIRFRLKTCYSNSRALIVGINDYVKASPLSYAVNDAKEVRDVLISELGFPEDKVTFLANSEATKETILKSYLAYASPSIDLDERIIFFFAGHGYTRTGIRGEIGYLVPVDGDSDDISTLIRWDELTTNAELVLAKHMLFVMDACYGGLALTRNLAPGSARFLKDMLLRYSRQVLTAGKADEVVSDAGGPLPGHSVFTGHLIEGLRGKAATEDGVVTANGLMSYVYGKVANDRKSRQTPHYGYFDGDGDFILRAPQLEALDGAENKDLDTLLVVPLADGYSLVTTNDQKISKVKLLLSNETSSIELHDFVMDEVRRFLAETSEDHFKMEGRFSKEEIPERISKYEHAAMDLSLIIACIACWGKPAHKSILQKAISRATDRLEPRSGLSTWLELRWYPLILDLYCSGIAAIENRRYDNLANLFLTSIGPASHERPARVFVEAVAKAVLQLTREQVFKQLPGYERFYTPMSEYLFKVLQPQLDDLLFLGTGYERVFDEFEILFALVTADLKKQRGQGMWGPVGRFGWKQHRDESSLSHVMDEARVVGEDWGPLKFGLFGGNIKRFNEVANEYLEHIQRLGWW